MLELQNTEKLLVYAVINCKWYLNSAQNYSCFVLDIRQM